MPRLAPPTIRRKSNGAYIVHWSGKDWYLSTDRAVAETLFLDADSDHPGSLRAWQAWRASRAVRPHALTIAELHDRFMASVKIDRPGMSGYYTKHLARFIAVHGRVNALTATTPQPARGLYTAPVTRLLEALRLDLLRAPKHDRLAPRTINHDLVAVKRLFNWAAGQGLCPKVDFAGVGRATVPRSMPEPLHRAEIRQIIEGLAGPDDESADPRSRPTQARDLATAFAVNYLTACRPSETIAIILVYHALRAGQRPQEAGGAFHALAAAESPGKARALLELQSHKTSRLGHQRLLILTDEALTWLDCARPRWKTLWGYEQAAARFGFAGLPHRLRDSAASHLRESGAALEEVAQALGHARRGVTWSYMRESWPALRARLASAVTLLPPPPPPHS